MNFDPHLTYNKILSRVVTDKETRASVDIYIEVYQITIFYTQLNAKRRLLFILYVNTSAQTLQIQSIKFQKFENSYITVRYRYA